MSRSNVPSASGMVILPPSYAVVNGTGKSSSRLNPSLTKIGCGVTVMLIVRSPFGPFFVVALPLPRIVIT